MRSPAERAQGVASIFSGNLERGVEGSAADRVEHYLPTMTPGDKRRYCSGDCVW